MNVDGHAAIVTGGASGLGAATARILSNNVAKVCILDLDAPWIVKAENLKSKSKNTAIEGRKLQGKILMTFLNGELVFNQ